MPDLKWQGTVYNTIKGKAEALCRRFYPKVEADTRDIVEPDLQEELEQELEIEQKVTLDEIWTILQSVKPDKCPGADEIPNWFLQTIGEPLIKAVQSLATAVIKISHYPQRF